MEGPIQRAWWFCAVVVLVVGMFGLVASMVVVAEPAGAATVLFVAATGSDTNPCSAAAPCATITHALSSLPATIEVAGTVDDNASISSTVTIEQWSGQSPAVVDGRGLGSVFTVLPAGNLTVDRLTLTGGSAVSGGGINSSGTATIIDCTIASNSAIADLSGAGYGGGIVSTGPLTITDSTITNNTAAGGGIADGGGIVNSGPLTITDSTISDNSATTSAPGGSALGGAIYNEIGPLTIAGSTIAGNTATGPNTARGGAIYNTGTVNITATLNITTSTLTSNSVGSSIAVGGAIDNGGTATITTSTITSNTTSGSGASFVSGGGGLMNEPSSRLTVADSTIAGNSVAATGLGGESGGGGLDNNGTASVTDSTITGNSANDPARLHPAVPRFRPHGRRPLRCCRSRPPQKVASTSRRSTPGVTARPRLVAEG